MWGCYLSYFVDNKHISAKNNLQNYKKFLSCAYIIYGNYTELLILWTELFYLIVGIVFRRSYSPPPVLGDERSGGGSNK